MSRRLTVELDLPDEVVAALAGEDMTAKLREMFVMNLVREHRISQGKAAEILGISREEIFPLMSKHEVPVIDLPADELQPELDRPFPRGENFVTQDQ
jgi:predicted HTH domain antitoxin